MEQSIVQIDIIVEIFFNELSLFPNGESIQIAQQRITGLLLTLKKLRKYDFRKLRTHNNFLVEELCSDYTFADFLNDSNVRRDHKILLQSIIANPFICENSEEEAYFILNKFETENHLGELVESEGIAAAYVYENPIVSINSCHTWNKSPISLKVTNGVTNDNIISDILNFWNEESVIEWADGIADKIPLNCLENIQRVFPKNQFKFEKRAIDELIEWYYDDIRYQDKIRNLIFDIPKNPFVSGLGHTEILKKRHGMASKKIVKKDRITYKYTRELITIHQCKGHYDDK